VHGGQKVSRVGVHFYCFVWEDISCGDESWSNGVGKAIANEVMSTNFANPCAFKNVVTKKWVEFSTAGAVLFGWGREDCEL
jgi:hypothetical protein